MVGIVPKKKSKGVDFCGDDEHYYIIRSDLNCYLRSSDFQNGDNLCIFTLHPSCRDGDHYLAHEDGYFYIIKGSSYRQVTSLNTDEDATVYSLHPNCQGGDHYLSASNYYYIIYQSRGVYRRTKNMNNNEDSDEFNLSADYKNGLYYFGMEGYCYFVKPHKKWGIHYYQCSNFKENQILSYSFHPSVINFLPGGLAITKGPSFCRWECIKNICNHSDNVITWTKQNTMRVGYEKEKMSSIEHKWTIALDDSMESIGLTTFIAKAQFSLKTEYGGSSVNTDRENWDQATEVEETIAATLQPQQCLYIWQYKLGLGSESVLHCHYTTITDEPIPPTRKPLPST
ncbi:uncharacterized protein LOC108702916 [Xenopus laevis]|uniref:Uncharacterized protein n=2 Tax=Xenopus laevis TaxID=8355 RepID=A0A974BUC8_XENLA|nr:uncharacterized protein LOC108702916 [Xenopus laevis]OCT60970.1 hypothetical protein XELAEV_18046996mg [Xenopus laevis]